MRPATRQLLMLGWPQRRRYLAGMLALSATDLGNLSLPWILGRFIDAARAGRLTVPLAGRYALMMLAAGVAIAAFRYLWRICLFGAARAIELGLRQRLFEKVLELPATFFQQRTVGELMAHATGDVGAIRSIWGEGTMAGFDSVVMIAATLTIMAGAIDGRLTVAALLPLPLIALLEWRLGRSVHRRYTRVQEAYGNLSERTVESVTGMRVIKAYAQESATHQRFEADNRLYTERALRLANVNALNEPAIALLSGLSIAVSLGYGGFLTLKGQVSLGQFVAFQSYLGMLSWPMLALGWSANLLQRATASMERLMALFDAPPAEPPGKPPLAPGPGALEVCDLSFAYGPASPPVLAGVSFKLEPGRMLGITGPTGSGKSTLASLLVRTFEPPEGTVLLDGQDVTTHSLASLRQAIAYVPQDTHLFSESIADNLGFDPSPHTNEARRAAAAQAQLLAEIEAMPEGMETTLGERGITLSGGQRQRLSIARALLKPAPVLLLDDCLSAVDGQTENQLLETLRDHARTRTTLLISHRIAALRHAHHILVLEGGRIVESGTHAELLERHGLYRRLADRQSLEATVEPRP